MNTSLFPARESRGRCPWVLAVALLRFAAAGVVFLPPCAPAQHAHSLSSHEFEISGYGGVASQPDGKVLLWGSFNEVNGVARPGIARLNADGSLDTTWQALGIPNLERVVVSGEEILAVSRDRPETFGSDIGTLFTFLDNTTGVVVATHSVMMSGVTTSVAFNGDHIYFGSFASTIEGQSRSTPARVARDSGAFDADYHPSGNNFAIVERMAIADDGLYVTGFFSEMGGEPRLNVAKLKLDDEGSANTSWNLQIGALDSASPTGISLDGEFFYISGNFTSLNGSPVDFIGRVSTTDATPDTTWRPMQGIPGPGSFDVGVIVAGNFAYFGDFGDDEPAPGYAGIARVAVSGPNSGILDPTWKPAFGNGRGVVTTAVRNDSGLFFGGGFHSVAATESAPYFDRFGICRLDEATAQPSKDLVAQNFQAGGDVTELVALPDGSTVVGGGFDRVDGVISRGLCKFRNDGPLDTSFAVATSNGIEGLRVINEIHYDGSAIYVGGRFNRVGQSLMRNNLFRMDVEGNVDALWDPDVDGEVEAVVSHGGFAYIGGRFGAIGVSGNDRLGRVSTAGTGPPDATWTPAGLSALSESVRCLAVDDNWVYAGGFFDVGSSDSIARFSTTGGGDYDSSWLYRAKRSSFNGIIEALVLDGTSLYVGGLFTTMESVARSHLARISTTGVNVDPAFDVPVDATSSSTVAVRELLLDTDTLYVAGAFTGVGGLGRNNLGAIALGVSPATIPTWNPNVNNQVEALDGSGGTICIGGRFSQSGDLGIESFAQLVPLPFAYVDWQGNDPLGPDTYDMAIAGMRANPDKDTLPNIAEFHLRLDSHLGNSPEQEPGVAVSGQPVVFEEGIAYHYQTIRNDSEGLGAFSESNSELEGSWAPMVPASETDLGGGWKRYLYENAGVPSSQPRLFFRDRYPEPAFGKKLPGE